MPRYLQWAAVALALSGCAIGAQEAAPRKAWTAAEIAAARLDPNAAVAALNAYRSSRGLKPVRLDPALASMAERQAKAMASAGALSHDVAGGFSSRLAASGVDAAEAGENVGAGYFTFGEALAGWRQSPHHDANLLMEGATRFGVAIAKNPQTEYGVYWSMEIAGDPIQRAPAAGAFLPLSGAAAQLR